MVGRAFLASRKVLEEGRIWIELRPGFRGPARDLDTACFVLDEPGLVEVPGPQDPNPNTSGEEGEAEAAEEASVVYAVHAHDLALHAAACKTGALVGTLSRFSNVQVTKHVFNAENNQIWGRISLDGVAADMLSPSGAAAGGSGEATEPQPLEAGRATEVSGVAEESEGVDRTYWVCTTAVLEQDVGLVMTRADVPLGQPWCFRNTFTKNAGRLPIRAAPSLQAAVVEYLPAFVIVHAASSIIKDGQIWVQLSEQFRPFVNGWVIYRNATDGSVVVEPHRLFEETELCFRNILKKAALPFRDEPSLESAVVARLPLGGCVRGVTRTVTKGGQLWAQCIVPGHDEPLWAVERNARDGTTILQRILPAGAGQRHVYRVVHNGALPVLTLPGFGPESREVGEVNRGDYFYGLERRFNERFETWVAFRHEAHDDLVWVAESIGGVTDSIEVVADVFCPGGEPSEPVWTGGGGADGVEASDGTGPSAPSGLLSSPPSAGPGSALDRGMPFVSPTTELINAGFDEATPHLSAPDVALTREANAAEGEGSGVAHPFADVDDGGGGHPRGAEPSARLGTAATAEAHPGTGLGAGQGQGPGETAADAPSPTDTAAGEADLEDLLNALDAFAEDDARREAERRRRAREKEQAILYEESKHLRTSVPPVLSPSGGRYCGPLTVTLTCEVPTAVIFYTLDGTSPNPTYALTEPLELVLEPGVTHIQAISISPGMEPSQEVDAKFVVTSWPMCILKSVLGFECLAWCIKPGLGKIRRKRTRGYQKISRDDEDGAETDGPAEGGCPHIYPCLLYHQQACFEALQACASRVVAKVPSKSRPGGAYGRVAVGDAYDAEL